ncbi:MAG TPA: HAD family hydrolase [Candidatus Thermoplasmatota archaeon]|nr:HAD family hydrolase [Candidatus Thermoplasmatota archaeon]
MPAKTGGLAAALAPMRALAVDYDRTLTDPALVLWPATVEALVEARKKGLAIIVVSGRDLAFLEHALGRAASAFVAENGAVVSAPGGSVEIEPTPAGLREALAAAGIEVRWHASMGSLDAEHEQAARAAAAEGGIEATFERNRESLMALPPGVGKARGLLRALDLLKIDPSEVFAIGDGENDVSLLETAAVGIAVANAVPELAAAAEHVTRGEGGKGVAEVLAAWAASRS